MKDVPGEETSHPDVNGQSELPVQNGWRVPLLLLDLNLILWVGRATSRLLVVVGESTVLLFGQATVLLDIVSNNMMMLEVVRILGTWLEELADLLVGRSSGVDWCRVVDVGSMRAVVQVLVLMFPRNV